ncbi:SAM-dependent methyltransferase [Paraglaciecola sp. 2405UD69-4]|uniref:SAM-dependent methyltransferase n=1 Tax=Paraglaciecola sp. 2405UD69-4 TaxID=3391836 RepID=UPI0039C99AE5
MPDSHPSQGSLTIVGTGISVSGQMTLITESTLKNADIVLAVVTQSALVNLKSINSNTVSLRDLYDPNLSRLLTYRKMQQRIVTEVEAGKKVVAAFYGHPGVFVTPSHDAIEELTQKGYKVKMLPGVSAEDCLIADLSLDPARYGCQSYEATQFLFRRYSIDPHMLQIIWQIGSIADFNHTKNKTDHPGLLILMNELLKFYSSDHEVIIYEAATIPLLEPKIEKIPLNKLKDIIPKAISTLVIPAIGLPDYNIENMAKFGLNPDSFKQILLADNSSTEKSLPL